MKTSIFSRTIKICAILAMGISINSVSAVSAGAQSNSGAAKLHMLLRSHTSVGQRVTQDVKNATGDPHIQVIDRRHTFGEVYRCSYSYRGNPRYRILVCD